MADVLLVFLKYNLLINDGYIIAEHSEKIKLDDHKKFVKSKNYGGCSFSFFKI